MEVEIYAILRGNVRKLGVEKRVSIALIVPK
jgi:hypothetical protein